MRIRPPIRNLSGEPRKPSRWPKGVRVSETEVEAGVPSVCAGCGRRLTVSELYTQGRPRLLRDSGHMVCCPDRKMISTGEVPEVGRLGWTGNYDDEPHYITKPELFTEVPRVAVGSVTGRHIALPPNSYNNVGGVVHLLIDVRSIGARLFLSEAGMRAARRAMGDVRMGHVVPSAHAMADRIAITDGSTTRVLKDVATPDLRHLA